MPNFEPNPEPKHIITDQEFFQAATSSTIQPTDHLYIVSKDRIHRSLGLSPLCMVSITDSEYLVVQNTRITAADLADFDSSKDQPVNRGILLVNCLLPGLRLYGTWTGGLVLKDTQITGNIIFPSQTTIGDIWLENSNCENIFVDNASITGEITLTDNSRVGEICVRNGSACNHITLEGTCECQLIQIIHTGRCGHISIIDQSKSGDIIVADKSKTGDIIVRNNSKAENIIIVNDSLSDDIAISNFSHVADIRVYNFSACGNLTLNNNSDCGILSVGVNSSSNSKDDAESTGRSRDIRLRDSSARQISLKNAIASLELQNARIPLLLIEKCHIHRLDLRTGTSGNIFIFNSRLNHLKLEHFALLKDSVLFVSHTAVFIVQMVEFLVQGQLVFRKLAAASSPFELDTPNESFTIQVKNNFDSVNLLNIHKHLEKLRAEMLGFFREEREALGKAVESLKSEFGHPSKALFRVVGSSLNKAEITGSDLRGFTFEYFDSKLLDLFVSGTELPREEVRIYFEEDDKPDAREEARQKISLYNQLKKVLENQGDNINSTWYHSIAADNQQILLRLYSTGKGNKRAPFFSDARFDALNIKLNKLSSNHGESWRKALYFILWTSALFYILVYAFENHNQKLSLTGIPEFLHGYFSFLDITHKEDFLGTGSLSLPAKMLDFFGRIILGYGIYQFIAAFRRHGRKAQ